MSGEIVWDSNFKNIRIYMTLFLPFVFYWHLFFVCLCSILELIDNFPIVNPIIQTSTENRYNWHDQNRRTLSKQYDTITFLILDIIKSIFYHSFWTHHKHSLILCSVLHGNRTQIMNWKQLNLVDFYIFIHTFLFENHLLIYLLLPLYIITILIIIIHPVLIATYHIYYCCLQQTG